MQRGRGRGRNPNPARHSSRRGSRSSARRATTQATIRRSARLAQLLNGNAAIPTATPVPAANGSMADVARPRTIENRAVGRSVHQSGRSSGPSRSGRASPSPDSGDIRYAMDVIVQPPATARAGNNWPLIVRLRTTNTDSDPEDALLDSANLVAVATLIPAPNSSSSSDPNTLNALLAGRRFDSIHPFSDDEADGSLGSMDMDGPRGVGYVHFPDLVIRQAGTWCVRITLIRIRSSIAEPPASSIAGGANVQVVDTNPIVVQQGSGPSAMAHYNGGDEDEDDDGGWLEVLRTLQTRRRSNGGG